jgi:hypothetical protein
LDWAIAHRNFDHDVNMWIIFETVLLSYSCPTPSSSANNTLRKSRSSVLGSIFPWHVTMLRKDIDVVFGYHKEFMRLVTDEVDVSTEMNGGFREEIHW